MKRIAFTALLLVVTSALVYANTNKKTMRKRAQENNVVLIAIDGWGAYSVPNAHDIPNIRYFMDNGCYTLKDRSVLESSSAINWASMFMGVPTEIHGYTTWGSRSPEIPPLHVNSHGIGQTIFSVVREQLPKAETACYFEWDGIKYLVDTLAISNFYEAKGYDNDHRMLCTHASNYIKQHKPKFMAICFDQLDHTGHGKGHDTPDYYNTLADIDLQIGQIVEAIKEAGMWQNTIVILTADHGGINKTHGGISLREMEIPFIIWGKGIRKGQVLTEQMMQYDCAATIAEALGLERPATWRGVPAYSAFEK